MIIQLHQLAQLHTQTQQWSGLCAFAWRQFERTFLCYGTTAGLETTACLLWSELSVSVSDFTKFGMKVAPLHVTPTSIPAVAGGCEVEATLSASCMVIMSGKKKNFLVG